MKTVLPAVFLSVAVISCGGGGAQVDVKVEEQSSADAGPRWTAPPDVSDLSHGPEGDPTDAEGCRRDFCPTAWPGRTSLNTNGEFRSATSTLRQTECMCWCKPWLGPGPGSDYMEGWTWNPWTVEWLPWARQQWSTFCPDPQP
jgi:hypothetical protein